MNSRFRICRFVCRSHYGLRRGDVFEGRTGFGGVSGYCGSSLSFEYDGTGTLISRTQTSGGITTKTEYILSKSWSTGSFVRHISTEAISTRMVKFIIIYRTIMEIS